LAESIKIPGLLNNMNGIFFLIIYQTKYVPAIFRKKDKETEEDNLSHCRCKDWYVTLHGGRDWLLL